MSTTVNPQRLSESEREAILRTIREFAAQKLAPYALEWDRCEQFPRDVLAAAGELGLGGIYVADRWGGTGLSRIDAIAVFEQLAMGDPSIAAYISIHNMVGWMIDAYGTDEQRRTWLPRLVGMTDLGAYCLTEPGAGSDAAAITTAAVADGDGYLLTGVKQFISGAGEAAVYVVMARTGEPGARGISRDRGRAGLDGIGSDDRDRPQGVGDGGRIRPAGRR